MNKLSKEDLFERQLFEEENIIDEELVKEAEKKCPNDGNSNTLDKYNLAMTYVRSKGKINHKKGIQLFEFILHNEISSSNKQIRRECYYFLAIGYFKIGKLLKAKQYCEQAIELEKKLKFEKNSQATILLKVIHKKLKSEGVKGLGIIGGIGLAGLGVAGLGIAIGTVFLTRKNKK